MKSADGTALTVPWMCLNHTSAQYDRKACISSTFHSMSVDMMGDARDVV